MVDGLLGQAETSARAPAHLDDDERGGRTRVDRHEIEFVATDMDVPGEDGPARRAEMIGNERFGGITHQLRPGPRPSDRWTIHTDIVSLGPWLAIDCRFTHASPSWRDDH
jgi:hypothetical protein